MSGFDFPIRRVGGGGKSDLKKRCQTDLALKSNKIGKEKQNGEIYVSIPE
jgi:hypothetical protein